MGALFPGTRDSTFCVKKYHNINKVLTNVVGSNLCISLNCGKDFVMAIQHSIA